MFIPVVVPNRNVRSGKKSDRPLHKYHVKEVRAHSGTGLDKRNVWADQLSQTFDPPMFS